MGVLLRSFKLVRRKELKKRKHFFGITGMLSRDGILRKRREHAHGRNLADCGRICGSPHESFGSIEEMWKKYSK